MVVLGGGAVSYERGTAVGVEGLGQQISRPLPGAPGYGAGDRGSGVGHKGADLAHSAVHLRDVCVEGGGGIYRKHSTV